MGERQTTERREAHASGTVHLRTEGEGAPGRVIEGRAIVFNSPSAQLWSDEVSEAYEEIAPEAVTRALLDSSDILMTLYHDDTRLLARSNRGAEGASLSYGVDGEGVTFRFTAPNTADGDAAVELVRSGVIDGCSFRFRTRYCPPNVKRTASKLADGRTKYVFTVLGIDAIEDFTLTPRPAYASTEVSTRSLGSGFDDEAEERKGDTAALIAAQVEEMRRAARL